FARAGLSIAGVERVAIHGGSLRIFVRAGGVDAVAPSVAALLREERELGLTAHAYYAQMPARVEAVRRPLLAMLGELRAAGHTLAAYGAAAKGATLLNAFGIG